jgi:excisionase family DNA binding protein
VDRFTIRQRQYGQQKVSRPKEPATAFRTHQEGPGRARSPITGESLIRLKGRLRMTEVREKVAMTVMEWAKRIPVAQIPTVLTFLAARLLAETPVDRGSESNCSRAEGSGKLFTASELARRLNLPESWIRSEERAGRIPGIRAGKYVRFKPSDVEQALAQQRRHRA